MFLVYKLKKRDFKKKHQVYSKREAQYISFSFVFNPLMFFFSFTMKAWLFKRRMNAEMTLYCRQVISRFDLRCSALLPLSLCRLLQ